MASVIAYEYYELGENNDNELYLITCYQKKF